MHLSLLLHHITSSSAFHLDNLQTLRRGRIPFQQLSFYSVEVYLPLPFTALIELLSHYAVDSPNPYCRSTLDKWNCYSSTVASVSLSTRLHIQRDTEASLKIEVIALHPKELHWARGLPWSGKPSVSAILKIPCKEVYSDPKEITHQFTILPQVVAVRQSIIKSLQKPKQN